MRKVKSYKDYSPWVVVSDCYYAKRQLERPIGKPDQNLYFDPGVQKDSRGNPKKIRKGPTVIESQPDRKFNKQRIDQQNVPKGSEREDSGSNGVGGLGALKLPDLEPNRSF